MKSMSQVLHIAQCPETLEEARLVITDQAEQLSRVRELLMLERATNAKLREELASAIEAKDYWMRFRG